MPLKIICSVNLCLIQQDSLGAERYYKFRGAVSLVLQFDLYDLCSDLKFHNATHLVSDRFEIIYLGLQSYL